MKNVKPVTVQRFRGLILNAYSNMNSKYHHRKFLLRTIKRYRTIIKEITLWQDQLTGGQVSDALLERDSVQMAIDEFSAVKNLDSEDLEFLNLRLSEIGQLDAMLKHEAPRVVASNALSEIRNDKRYAGWWWHLDEL
jgi:hypothetical protein